MKKPVNNLSDAPIILGGVEIVDKEQRIVRESLITDEERKAIVEAGNIINFKPTFITVKKAEANLQGGNDANQEQKDVDTTAKDTSIKVAHMAYPSSLINVKGEVSGSPVAKKEIAELQEKHGEKLVSDNAFKELYPDADIEAYRVETEEV